MIRNLNNRLSSEGVPIDDQIVNKASVLYDIFSFGHIFSHHELTMSKPSLKIGNHEISFDGTHLFLDQDPWTGDMKDGILALPHEKLEVLTTIKPKTNFVISSSKDSGITIPTKAFALVTFNEKNETYQLNLFSNGVLVYFNGNKVDRLEKVLSVGDQLVIDGVLIELREKQFKLCKITNEFSLNSWEIINEIFIPEYPKNFPEFRRSPRIHLREPKEEIAIQPPRAEETDGRSDLLRTIVPPLAMVVLSGATSVLSNGNPIMMLSMGGVSLLTAGFSVSSYITNKKEVKQKNLKRSEYYEKYLIQKEKELSLLSQKQLEALTYNFPDMDSLSLMTKEYSPRIYEKTMTNADFISIRLGHGEIQSSYKVSYHSREEDDALSIFAEEKIVWPHQTLKDAPIAISTLNQTLGLAGTKTVLRIAVQTILFQLSVLHSYRDVEFVALVPEEDYQDCWHAWRWLPHFQIRSLNLRGIIHNSQTRDMVLNSFYQLLTKRRQQVKEAGNEKVTFAPHYMFTILDESWLSGHGLNEFLAEDMSQYGVTVIWGKDALNMLPETATTVIDYQSNESAVLINNNNEYVNQLFVPNHLPKSYPIEQAIQRIANLEHVEVEKNAIPESIDFLELYDVKNVGDLHIGARWEKADTSKSLAVPLGVRGKDDIVYLNLHERAHGPHGLVAGTTGSGKSEIVQSYILSLAVNFAPEDVGFLPIDFKGGGMANLFKNLPHLLGSITNLDGASSARALQSIRAELQKRQRKFGEFGVNHINGYTKLYKQGKEIADPVEKKKYPSEPLPHLFLISDEFAELKANEPDFMAELVSTARIGRSLGVHLILATQKPSGVVDDQIWSNSRFKLALKVADPSDSNEIIKTPDAATITQPGRAYLQVGNNEIYELFQSAWSGAYYNPDAQYEEKVDERIWLINQLGQHELLTTDLSQDDEVSMKKEEKQTQLDAIVEDIVIHAEKTNAVLPEKPWLPPLKTEIDSPKINVVTSGDSKRNLSVPFGLMDIPSRQEQIDFLLNLEELNHLAIYGSPGFGKSTALQTLVMNLSRINNPEQVQFNLFDFGTNGLLPIKDLPHVVDIVRLEEEEKLMKFLKRIRKEIQSRKDAFTEYGVASLSQYEEKSGKQLPGIVTIVDGFDSIKESPLEEAIESVLNQLLREGASLGLYVVMTVLRTNSFRMSMASNIPSHIGLFLVEEGAIRDVVGRDALISQEIVGRAQIKLDEPHEVQIYLPTHGKNDIDRLNNLEQEIAQMNQQWKGTRPTKIPMLSKTISMHDFYTNPQVQEMLDNLQLPLALSKETTNVVGFVPEKHGYFVIGDDTPQQTEYIERIIVQNFKHFEGKAQRIVFNGSERFGRFKESFDVIVSDMEYSTFVNDLMSEIEERETQSENQPMFVYIPDAQIFGDKTFISDETFNKYLKNGSKVGVYFIFHGNQKQIENSYDEFNKRLRANIPAGMIGTRLADQGFINVKSSYSEPTVELDESHFFVGRNAGRVKLVSE
ncbi:type VII secretion protein EssC [Bacillus mycoides]|uniref:type VII secretion protein EssC n=1 Tax=Bacillus mycoides TaxID=1405 RepID=UPI003D1DA7AA